ncbi:MAG TPA: hypothetical protein VMA37_05935 [Acetobacteraceae bacterium]|nr:hypothetical protein [Acetobacteraceae bacterium]
MSAILPRRWWRRLTDALLLPFALALVLTEDVLWAGAKALLRGFNRLPLLGRLRSGIARLPAAFALPLFLIPEILSHLGEIYTAVLLAQGCFRAAILVAVLGKGLATLIVVWIYQAAAPTLLRVRWFARLHHAVLEFRYWTLTRVAPLYARLVRRRHRRPYRDRGGGLTQLRLPLRLPLRFLALCRRLSAMFGWRPSHHH